MRGARPLAIVLILSMMSACAGRHAAEPDLAVADRPADEATSPIPRYAETSDLDVEQLERLREYRALAAAHGGVRHEHRPPIHYHEEPSPEAQRTAEAVLLVTASVFVCTFVVVVLDGACDFGVHAGYYYY